MPKQNQAVKLKEEWSGMEDVREMMRYLIWYRENITPIDKARLTDNSITEIADEQAYAMYDEYKANNPPIVILEPDLS